MRKEQKDIDGLGPIGIARESFKLWWFHSRFFILIQLTLILPITVLAVGGEFFIYWIVPSQDNQPPGTSRIPHLPSNLRISIGGASVAAIVFLLVLSVGSIFLEGILSLSAASTLHAVGLNYTGQIVSFQGVLSASIPRLWMRLFVTGIYKVLVTYAMLMVQTVVSLLLLNYSEAISLPVVLVGITATGLLIIVGAFIVDLFFFLAAGVSVLEKDYGWAAVGRASKLLKGRLVVAILFRLLWVVPILFTMGLQRLARFAMPRGDFSALRLTAFVLVVVVYVLWSSFVWQMRSLCAGVQYASFKAFHNEDLEESIYEKQVMKGGYERVGEERTTDDAQLGGKNAETFA